MAKLLETRDVGLKEQSHFERAMDGVDTTSSVWVEMDMSVSLAGGNVLVSVADVESFVKLTKLVTDAIESREGRDGVISNEDLVCLSTMHHELILAADLLGGRITSERARTGLQAKV